MPRHDGTGPSGSGQPGRGFGPCGKHADRQPGRLRMRRFAHRQMRICFAQSGAIGQDFIYDYSEEELNHRKQALQKELQWLDARISELGNEDENSHSVN